MKICESNLKDITTWLITVYSLGYSVSKAGVNFIKLSQAIQAASTLLIGQLPSLASALATGAKTAGTISGKILGISVIISVADLIQTWISKNATLTSIDKDIALLEQQLVELKRIADAYHA
jgi:sensor histidine kinase YesM